MLRSLVLILFAALIVVGCVPNKKIVYLQSENELKQEFPTDSVLRTYNLMNYEYRIKPEDILSIRIESLTSQEYDIFSKTQPSMGNSNLNTMAINGYLVNQNGSIEFPVEGEVEVAGLTVKEANDKIQSVADKYLKNATAYVRLLNFRVTIIGEVLSPGTITLVNNRTSILEIVGAVGGLTELADRSKVKLVRQKGNQAEVVTLNLTDESLLSSNYYYVHQNDVIVVPPLKQRPFRKYFGQNVSLFLSSISTLLLIVNLINN